MRIPVVHEIAADHAWHGDTPLDYTDFLAMIHAEDKANNDVTQAPIYRLHQAYMRTYNEITRTRRVWQSSP